jgi:hypothetical protein
VLFKNIGMNCIKANNPGGVRIRIKANKHMRIGSGLCLVVGRGAKGADGTTFAGQYFDDDAAALGGVQIGQGYELAFPNGYDMPLGMTKIRRT